MASELVGVDFLFSSFGMMLSSCWNLWNQAAI